MNGELEIYGANPDISPALRIWGWEIPSICSSEGWPPDSSSCRA